MHLERYHHGVGSTLVQFRDADTKTWEEWYSRCVELVDALGESPLFEVENTTYRHDPGQFVTNGVVCFYQNRSFLLYSDLPNEVLVTFKGLRPHKAEVLAQALAQVWAKVGE